MIDVAAQMPSPPVRAVHDDLAPRLGDRINSSQLHNGGLAALEHGEGAAVMWAIKHALDPDGFMNPGRLLPPHG